MLSVYGGMGPTKGGKGSMGFVYGAVSTKSMWLELALWCHIAWALTSADFYVQSLPGYDSKNFPTMHAGLLEVGSAIGPEFEGSNLFFWHIAAEQNTHTTVVWLNGGPGCSSMDGAMLELGPFRFDTESGTIYRDDGSWSSFANLLFIDQPFGTGFSDPEVTKSSNKFVDSLEQAGDAVAEMLYKYAEIFPEIANTKVYLAGESFAGQYIPHVWQALRRRPEIGARLSPIGESTSGLAGLFLMSPWINPPHQYLSQALYAKNKGLIDPSNFDDVDALNDKCRSSLESSGGMNFINNACEHLTQCILRLSRGGISSHQCFNVYDISLTSPYPDCGAEWPDTLPAATEYLSQEDVRKALNAEPLSPAKRRRSWNECSQDVNRHLKNGEVSLKLVGHMVEDLPLMIIVGENDYICNYIGLETFLHNLEWGGSTGFDTEARAQEWGSEVTTRRLTFVKVTNGSHMLPVKHLDLSRELARRFVGLPSEKESEPTETSPVPPSEEDNDNTEEINKAMYRAYKQAGVVALIVVLIVVAILGMIWCRAGQGLSGKGLLNALLHSSSKKPSNDFQEESVPLRRMGQRPDVIMEEDEFEV